MNKFERVRSIGIGLVMCVSMVAALHANSSDIIPPKKDGFRNAQIDAQKWPNGVIPYVIEETTTEEVKQKFLKHMVAFANQLDNCVRFVPRTNEISYLIINHTNADGCWSFIGMQQEPQTLSLGNGCVDRGALLHETLHAIGFHHEQCRPDRDDYLEIMVQNVKSDMLFNFDKQPSTTVTTLGLPYDYYSIMHYDVTSFTNDPEKKQVTMRVKDPNVEADLVGESQVFTLLDILKVKKFYGCIPDTTNTLAIAIKADNNKFISANAQGLIADADSFTTPSQQFEISFNYDSTVCLKSSENQKYLSVDDNGVVAANADSCEADSARLYLARFHIGFYVIRSKVNRKYLTKDKDFILKASSEIRKDATKFGVLRLKTVAFS